MFDPVESIEFENLDKRIVIIFGPLDATRRQNPWFSMHWVKLIVCFTLRNYAMKVTE